MRTFGTKIVKPEREWNYSGETEPLMSNRWKYTKNPYDAADFGILELGCDEMHNDDDRYIQWYNDFVGTTFPLNVGWCAIFASWCIGQSGHLVKNMKMVNDDFTRPAFSNGDNGLSTYIKMNRFIADKAYVPQRGDIIFLTNKTNRDMNRKSSISDKLYKPTHVGIVVKVNESENTVTTIEGNCSDRVKLVNRYLINPNIIGYGF